MNSISLALFVAIGVLMVDSIIEIALISSMVAWLGHRAGRDFVIDYNGGTFPLHGKPEFLIVDQGHTSNGAAGTAFVLIGVGGVLALWLRSKASTSNSPGLQKFGMGWYHLWLTINILSTILSLAALIYTFVVTNDHNGQTIEIAVAASLNNQPYPLDKWTPENWFAAVLQLPLASSSDRSDIRSNLDIMRGWKYNLIPMFLIGLAVCVLAIAEAVQRRRRASVTMRELDSEKP